MKPWYWIYPRADHEVEIKTPGSASHTAKCVTSGYVRVSEFAGKTYYHCPDCPCAYYTAEQARGCCSAQRHQKRYINRLAMERMQRRHRVVLDLDAV